MKKKRLQRPSNLHRARLLHPCLLALFIFGHFFTIANAKNFDALGRPGVHGGVVATTEPAATEVGADILRQGGNAIDAAAAVAFALNVVEPQSSGIGGGGFMMVYLAKTKETVVVDSRETAPAAVDSKLFLDTNGVPFSYDIRSTSGIAVGVPGMVRGVDLALKNWGTRSLAEVLTPAIQLASDGIRVSEQLATDIRKGIIGGRLSNEPGKAAYDEARRVFAPTGVPLKQGDLLIQPNLAKTFRIIAEQGPDAFYSGELAEALVATQRQARKTTNSHDQTKLQGRMTLHDLANYRTIIRQPVEAMYQGYRILSSPPPSSGGLTVLQILKLLERFPIGDQEQGFAFGSPRTFNVMIEAMRLAFADRAVWMGDADFVPVPIHGLLDEQYVASRSALINPDARQVSITAGNPLPFNSLTESPATHIQKAPPSSKEGVHTTHFTIIDHAGNIVTYTNTIEDLWGTGLMVPGFGFLLNNELTDFNPVPTRNPDPERFNPGANDAAGGKRPRSSMAPTIVIHGNQPIVAYGSPGGSTIINSVVNMTLNLLDHHFPIQEAVDAPRISQTDADKNLTLETHLPLTTIKGLKALGHEITTTSFRKIGSVQAVAIDESNGQQFGAADHRRGGSVISLP